MDSIITGVTQAEIDLNAPWFHHAAIAAVDAMGKLQARVPRLAGESHAGKI
jgi:hypothetical protein